MKKFETPTRVWINQPSTLQPLHKLNRQVVIAWTEPNGTTTIYFNKGSVKSMQVPSTGCLETLNSQGNIFEYDT